MKTFSTGFNCPLGWLVIRASEKAIVEISFSDQPPADKNETTLLSETLVQLDQYFQGRRREFDLPLDAAGTQFQQAVWRQLLLIAAGEVRTYGQVATALGSAGAARAVGGACHANPLALVIPCHRVVGANGSLTGFGGGLRRKRWLLDHERKLFGA